MRRRSSRSRKKEKRKISLSSKRRTTRRLADDPHVVSKSVSVHLNVSGRIIDLNVVDDECLLVGDGED